MQSAAQEVKSRINIVDLVGEYVKLTKAGANWKGLCPFHHEKSPSFMVNEEKQIFHCFGCGKGGDAIAFIMEIESFDFREALKLLAEKTGVELSQYNQKDYDNKNKTLEILELATRFYETQLWKGVGKDAILQYLHERGLTDDSIRNFRLGYAPNGWDNIIKFLTERGYSLIDIEKTGLLVKKDNGNGYYDRFRDRIMFPIADIMGKIVGYSARVAPGADESQAKYINTPETAVYHKSKILYGIFNAKSEIKNKNFALIVEGNMDVIAAHQAGLANTIAVSGTALTSDQLDILKRYTDNIKTLFDMDSAGEQALVKSADLCFQKSLNVSIVRLPQGKDASDAVQNDPQILVEAVEKATPAMEYFFTNTLSKYDKTNPRDKKLIVSVLLERGKNLENNIEKQHWIKKIAHELEVEETAVVGVLKSVLSSNNYVNKEKEEVIVGGFEKRSDVLVSKIAGILLSNSAVWKDFCSKYSEEQNVLKSKLLAYLLAKGSQVEYQIENLLLEISDQSSKKMLQKLCFDAKFSFASEDNVVEYTTEELTVAINDFLLQYEKELQKQRLSDIIKEIKLAEQAGDKQKLNILVSEFTRLTQELK